MEKLKKLEPQVKAILEFIPDTRSDDFLLVCEVYRNYIPLATPLGYALEHHKEYSLPSFASIIRVRRKVQTKYPSLCNARAVETSADAEADFKDYAREG